MQIIGGFSGVVRGEAVRGDEYSVYRCNGEHIQIMPYVFHMQYERHTNYVY